MWMYPLCIMTALSRRGFNVMQVKGVIFDMDGLMFDTERISRLAFEFVGRELGIDFGAGTPDTLGMNVREIKRIHMERFGPDFDFDGIREKRMAFRAAYIDKYGLPVKTGLRELVIYLRRHGLKWAVATSTGRDVTLYNLDITGFRADFPLMVCGDMVERSKPDPQIFCVAAELLGTSPEETVVLEDSYNGIRAAAAGGFITCMVPDLWQPDEEISALLTRKFDTLLDVIPFLDEVLKKHNV